MNLKASGVNPVVDIVHSIYFSTTSMPADAKSSIMSKKNKSGINTPKSQKSEEVMRVKIVSDKQEEPTETNIQPDNNAETHSNNQPVELKPAQLPKSKKTNFDDEFCPINLNEEEPTETASQILERNRLKRAEEEEKRRKCEKKKTDAAYKKFLEAQEAEKMKKIDEPPCKSDGAKSDDAKSDCYYDNECAKFPSEVSLGVTKKVEKIEFSKLYLKIKYAIQMQNYNISKLCQELKVMKQRGLHPQMARLKVQLRKEIERLQKMVQYAMDVQKEDSEGLWGPIPLSTISMAQLENNSYDFERVEMPKEPSQVSLSQNVLNDFNEKLLEEEREKLIKREDDRVLQQRMLVLYEKSRALENQLFTVKMENDGLKMKEKYFDSVRDDFNPDEKIKEVEEAMKDLNEQLTRMKKEFDDIHLELHESIK